MSSSTLFRVSGVVLILGSLMLIVGAFIHPARGDASSALQMPAAMLSFIGTMLALVSLPGLYARLHKQVGLVGLIGFVLFFLSGLMLGIGAGMLDIAVDPYLAQHAPALLNGSGPPIFAVYFPVAGIMQGLGALLFGIATIHAGALLGMFRWAGVVMIVGGILNFVGNFGPDIVGNIGLAILFAAVIWLGYFLVTEQQTASVRTTVATTD